MNGHHVSHLLLRALEHAAAAAAFLLCGFLLALLVRSLLRWWLRRHETRLGPSFVRIVSTFVYYVLIILTIGMSLIALGVPVNFVAAGILLLLAILAIALRESVADLAASMIFLTFRPFKTGEMIETGGYLGAVQEILMYTTVLKLIDERIVTLPNSKIHETGLVNYTRAGRLRTDFTFTLAYGQDLERVQHLIKQIVTNDDRVLATPPVEVAVDQLADTGIRLLVGPTIEVTPNRAPQDYWELCSDLRERIATKFTAEGIRFAVTPWVTPNRNPGGDSATTETPDGASSTTTI
ncbi:MAG TPA: mechanosensitive ion channel domain-containing protein [Jatrophihabitantaceae bacterium]